VERAELTVTTTIPVDLHRTLAPLRRGAADPTHQVAADGAIWRTTRMPSGPATMRLRQVGPTEVHAWAWGAGSGDALATVPALLGELDDASTFDPPPGLVRETYRRTSRVRLTRTGHVMEALVPAILEQRVTGRSARDAWRWLLRAHGTAAPGPAPEGMRVPPTSTGWADIPVWDFHRAGVDPGRAGTVVAAARLANRLEEASALGGRLGMDRLTYVRGVGPWTAAETAQRAWGDPDAVSVGDYHLPEQVGWALTGERGVDDEGMLRLLEPYRPHRYRAVLLLLLSGAANVPRRGPRLAVEDHRRR
jgi:3-methyladenine DNA glycosylase/8-oxoguanine DNA glycosylase